MLPIYDDKSLPSIFDSSTNNLTITAATTTVKPVAVTGGEAKGRPAPTAKDMGGTTSPKQGPAPKPVTAQASGVNTKSPVAKA